MNLFKSGCQLLIAIFLLSACNRGPGEASESRRRAGAVLIVVEGLRVDYVTPERMPHLTALAAAGLVFENHRAVFPSLTQVNAASMVTGACPATHGLMGDDLYLPEIAAEPLDTRSAATLDRIDRETGGQALGGLTLGELLEGEGLDFRIFSAGSSGLTWILSYGMEARPGRSLAMSPGFIRPGTMQPEVEANVGAEPSALTVAAERDRWATDLFLQDGLTENLPDLCILWLSGPDAAQHRYGVGSAEALHSIQAVDSELGKVLGAIRDRNLEDALHLFVTADHGFVQHNEDVSLSHLLLEAGLAEKAGASRPIVIGNEIHFDADAPRTQLDDYVQWLEQRAYVGGLFTRNPMPGTPSGRVSGTLSYETIYRDSKRAGDILVVPNWNDAPGKNGFRGISSGEGVAGHGGASPYELRIPLIASGPGLKDKSRAEGPTGQIDLAPTLLYLLGIDVPETMDGRVLYEALKKPPEGIEWDSMKRTFRSRAALKGGAERVTELHELGRGGVGYLQWVRGLYRAEGAGRDHPGGPPPSGSLPKSAE